MQEIQVESLGREDSLEEGVATHSSVLEGYSPWGHNEPDMTKKLSWTELNWTELNWIEFPSTLDSSVTQ